MPEAAVPQSLIWNLCVAAKRCEFAQRQAWAQGHSHPITQSTGQMIAKLAQSDNRTDSSVMKFVNTKAGHQAPKKQCEWGRNSLYNFALHVM